MTKTVCIIPCAGKATRWGNYLGINKHFIKINGEILIERIVKLFKKYCLTDHQIYVVGHNKQYELTGTKLFVPKHNYEEYGEADKYLCSESLWNSVGRTIVLLGDVWFSEEAMETIVGYKGDYWHAFGRTTDSSYTGCPWRELFAQSFLTKHQVNHKKNLLSLGKLDKTGIVKISSGWAHLNLMSRLDVNTDNVDYPSKFPLSFTVIDDFTDDFDFPEDYNRWIDNYQKTFNPRTSSIFSLGNNPENWNSFIETLKKLRENKQYKINYFMTSYAYQEVKNLQHKDLNKKQWDEIILKLLFEFSVSGYFVNRYSCARIAIDKIVFNELTHYRVRWRVLKNLRFYVNQLKYHLMKDITNSNDNINESTENFKKKYIFRGHRLKCKIQPIKIIEDDPTHNFSNHLLTICPEVSGEIILHRFLISDQKENCVMISIPFYFQIKGNEKCLDLLLSSNNKCYRIRVKVVNINKINGQKSNETKYFVYFIKSSTIHRMIQSSMKNLNH